MDFMPLLTQFFYQHTAYKARCTCDKIFHGSVSSLIVFVGRVLRSTCQNWCFPRIVRLPSSGHYAANLTYMGLSKRSDEIEPNAIVWFSQGRLTNSLFVHGTRRQCRHGATATHGSSMKRRKKSVYRGSSLRTLRRPWVLLYPTLTFKNRYVIIR